jgi:hypothetical protein
MNAVDVDAWNDNWAWTAVRVVRRKPGWHEKQLIAIKRIAFIFPF